MRKQIYDKKYYKISKEEEEIMGDFSFALLYYFHTLILISFIFHVWKKELIF